MKTRTLAMIKPKHLHLTKKIIELIKNNDFTIIAQKKLQFSKEDAAYFYQEHKNKPFFEDMITKISSGPVIVLLLEKENAVVEYRKLVGETNPIKTKKGTIRRLFGISKQDNVAHGSDSDESAKREIEFVFPEFTGLEDITTPVFFYY